jgi:hypothetical protein
MQLTCSNPIQIDSNPDPYGHCIKTKHPQGLQASQILNFKSFTLLAFLLT